MKFYIGPIRILAKKDKEKDRYRLINTLGAPVVCVKVIAFRNVAIHAKPMWETELDAKDISRIRPLR